jgi:hypothetical protein
MGDSVSNGPESKMINVKLNLKHNNTLAAHSESCVNSGTYSDSSSNVIGRRINSSTANSSSNISNMELNLRNNNKLKAFSDGSDNTIDRGTFDASSARVIGSNCNNSYNAGESRWNEIVNGVNWTTGDHNNLKTRAGGYHTPKSNASAYYYSGIAGLLGSNLNTNNTTNSTGGSLSQMSNLAVNIGNNNRLTARGSSCAPVLGTGNNSINQDGAAEATIGS